ncbi:MAG: DEAD/DEAH box helicase [Gemmatirosa sp.]|nr:DEAD/DEAH box helicase [Gemmatirosa sp.]
MPIPANLAGLFSRTIRARGEEYWDARRVHVLDTTHDRLDALVRGTLPYHVTLRHRDDELSLACSCAYVAQEEAPCKHLWAALLEADRLDHPVLDGSAEATVVVRPIEARPAAPARARRAPQVPNWKRELRRIASRRPYQPGPRTPAEWPAGRQLAYVLDVAGSPATEHGLFLELATRAPGRDGSARAPHRFAYSVAQWLAVPDEADREIAQMLLGAREEHAYGYASAADLGGHVRRFFLPASSFGTTLRRICETGRCHVRTRADEREPPVLLWDAGGSTGAAGWTLRLALDALPNGECRLEGFVTRGRERIPVAEPLLLTPGLVVFRDGGASVSANATGIGSAVAAPYDDFGAGDLARELRGRLTLVAPIGEAAQVATEIAALHPRLPPVELPEAFGVTAIRVPPHPVLALRATVEAAPAAAPAASAASASAARVDATLVFDYDGARTAADAAGTIVPQSDMSRVVYRDRAAESALVARLEAAGFRRGRSDGMDYQVAPARAPHAAAELAAEGWDVELEGRRVRIGRSAALRVRSGIDWFDLDATLDFGGVSAALPELLAALRRGERTVALGDGSLGVVPDAWAARYGLVAALAGRGDGKGARFTASQLALLDALLDPHEADASVDVDETFARARAALETAQRIDPIDPPAGFTGELRPYQRVGLGWLDFLRRVGFGGVLADDMGLGKTVQVLALLESRRQAGAGPSLVVVPRSLVFNWENEARRFTPSMRVLVHHGAGRAANMERLHEYDLVLTTYGTLRRDAVEFRDDTFDYVVLDEAQAIKNAGTATAKAARLLRGNHRLAMSGTPIENSLDDLWSLFEFLNPGMLGAAPAFGQLVRAGEDGGDAGRAIVARGVRPFLLRRTKEQVAPELPPRSEQTVWVELGATERRLYDELRDHFRASLGTRIARDGLARSRMHVLEALLRLRQAACHPALVDPARAGESSSKIDVLLSQVAEVVAEGHKALVFSQFTSLLALVRPQLDAAGITYEYLDGRTRDRARRVERFQSDPACPLFLVSLKAGGLGLNLTAADYVFLLDPWWNPAAEAQAIDRAHRIGQTRRVMALRLVARGTIEEKVLDLQRGKRELADAIVRADQGAVSELTAEELRMLLE